MQTAPGYQGFAEPRFMPSLLPFFPVGGVGMKFRTRNQYGRMT